MLVKLFVQCTVQLGTGHSTQKERGRRKQYERDGLVVIVSSFSQIISRPINWLYRYSFLNS